MNVFISLLFIFHREMTSSKYLFIDRICMGVVNDSSFFRGHENVSRYHVLPLKWKEFPFNKSLSISLRYGCLLFEEGFVRFTYSRDSFLGPVGC